MGNCPFCYKLILAHSWQIECKICYSSYHGKCLSLSTDDHEHMRANTATWYCSSCIFIQIFPLNTIEEDDILICELNGIDIDEFTTDSLSSRLFNPFQLNDRDYYTPLSQIDPGVTSFNNVNSHQGLCCNYYLEYSFYDLTISQMNSLTTENVFILCHLKVRNLRANLSAFELTLHNLGIHLTAIGISETWSNDYNCGLYNIDGYNLIEVHRQSKKGGSVSVFLDNSIPYKIRSNLCLADDVSECIFIEIDKEIFKKDKSIIIGVIYRPPNSDLNAFDTSMSLLLNELIQENKHCCIMGDYNINLLNYGNHQPTAEFIDQLHSNSFASLINKPMMTSSNGNIFRVTGPLCGEFTGPGEFPAQRPVTRSFDVYFDLRPNKRLSKQSLGWWFETLSPPLWRHRNATRVKKHSATLVDNIFTNSQVIRDSPYKV